MKNRTSPQIILTLAEQQANRGIVLLFLQDAVYR